MICCNNAHIISMTTVLEMVREMKTTHKWLVIGDIVDQGSIEEHEHEKLAELIASVKPEKVVLVGRRTKKYTAPLLEGKCDFESFDKPQQALKYLEANLTGKETVVFKGSQYLEWIVEKMLEFDTSMNFAEDTKFVLDYLRLDICLIILISIL